MNKQIVGQASSLPVHGASLPRVVATALLAAGLFLQRGNAAEKTLYQADFETNALNKLPEEFMVLDGGFLVKEQDGNKFLELPGAPLDTFGLLLGPTEGTGAAISARIYGLSKGRRFPTFAVGLNGVGGYKLQVSPAKNAVELFQGEDLLESAPFSWESGTWTRLRLKTREGPRLE